MKRRFFLSSLAVALAVASGLALAQSGGRPIRIVVSLQPGSAIDFQARLLAQYLTTSLGQPVVVENKAGGKDIIAMMDVIKSAPDGTTLYMGSQSPLAINVPMVKNLPYDPRKDVTPIAGSGLTNHVLIVKSDFPAKTIPEFIAYTKKNPGKVSVGFSTTTVQAEIAAMNKLAGIDLLPVPYKGVPATITDLLGGSLSATFVDPGNALAQIKNGTVRALGVTSQKRSPLTPDWPAISETLPGYDFPTFTAMVGPPGMSRDVVNKIHAAMDSALRQKDVVDKFAQAGTLPFYIKPEELKSLIDAETAKWIKIAKDENLQPE